MSTPKQFVPSGKKLTYEDYALIPDDGQRHEVIDGRHYVSPVPDLRHQAASRHIQYQLMKEIELKGLGWVFNAPCDVQLSDHSIVQPDLIVVLNDNRITTPEKINGIPDLVIEILSPGNRDYDSKLKKRLYEQSGTPEYWIVDPDECSVEQFLLRDHRNELAANCMDEITFRSASLAVTVSLTKVWSAVS